MTRFLLLFFAILLLPALAAFAAETVEDGVITDRVRQRLFSDPDVKGYTIEVETKEGVVTLSGSVETEKARTKAEKLTKKVSGVKRVVNQLRVELPRPR